MTYVEMFELACDAQISQAYYVKAREERNLQLATEHYRDRNAILGRLQFALEQLTDHQFDDLAGAVGMLRDSCEAVRIAR